MDLTYFLPYIVSPQFAAGRDYRWLTQGGSLLTAWKKGKEKRKIKLGEKKGPSDVHTGITMCININNKCVNCPE